MVFSQYNADEICAAENFYVKSSHGDNTITLKPKIQKKPCH